MHQSIYFLFLACVITSSTTSAFFWPFKKEPKVEEQPPLPPPPSRNRPVPEVIDFAPLPPKQPPKGKVMVLTEQNFNHTIESGNWVFVEFFAPWCGHCKQMAPEWELVASAFPPNENVIIATVDAEAYPALADEHGIDGYPTLKLFSDHQTVEAYDEGDSSAGALVAWVNKRVGTNKKVRVKATHVVKLNEENFMAKVQMENAALVEFYAPWCEHCIDLAPIYVKLAAVFKYEKKKLIIGKVDATKELGLSSKYTIAKYPTILYFPPNSSVPDPENSPYMGPRELVPMVDFLNHFVGLNRTYEGGLKWEVGSVPALETLLAENGYPKGCKGFPLNASFVETFSQTVQTLSGEEGEWGNKYFLPAIVKVHEHGLSVLDEEIKRLEGLIKEKKIDRDQRYQFEVKKNTYNNILYALVGR